MNKHCSHGMPWNEPCVYCEIVSLEDSIPRMEKTLAWDKARLKRLQCLKTEIEKKRAAPQHRTEEQ